MTDETTFGGSLSPEENAFFETGGESGVPTETGSDNSSGTSSDLVPMANDPVDQAAREAARIGGQLGRIPRDANSVVGYRCACVLQTLGWD